jgi:hypothetical protein
LATFLSTLIIVGFCLAGLGIGFLLRGSELKGSCGGVGSDQDEGTCVCSRKARQICPSDDPSGLVALAELGNPSRTRKDHEGTRV